MRKPRAMLRVVPIWNDSVRHPFIASREGQQPIGDDLGSSVLSSGTNVGDDTDSGDDGGLSSGDGNTLTSGGGGILTDSGASGSSIDDSGTITPGSQSTVFTNSGGGSSSPAAGTSGAAATDYTPWIYGGIAVVAIGGVVWLLSRGKMGRKSNPSRRRGARRGRRVGARRRRR
jgi:hypothetical protein